MFKNKQKWLERLGRFQRGRYGANDQLNRHLLIMSLVAILLGIFFRTPVLRVLSLAGIVGTYFRLFSKNIYRRSAENRKYVALLNKIKKPFESQLKRFQDRKAYKYFKCPECHQAIRAPRNKGTIRITCSNCQTKFEKKT